MIAPIHGRARVRSKSFVLAIETRRDDGEWTEVGYIPFDTRAHEIAQAIKAVCDAMPSEYKDGHGPSSYFAVEQDCQCEYCWPSGPAFPDPDQPTAYEQQGKGTP